MAWPPCRRQIQGHKAVLCGGQGIYHSMRYSLLFVLRFACAKGSFKGDDNVKLFAAVCNIGVVRAVLGV